MKKIEYLFLLLMILQSCNNTDTNQLVSPGLKVDSKDSLKLNQVINFNLIEYPGAVSYTHLTLPTTPYV